MSKVSIIMPCFNDGLHIQEAINSVLEQSYEDIEIIVINDGSTDDYTNNLLRTSKWPKTTILNSNRLRPAGARNLGIQSAKGKYILPLDADDKIEPNYIEKAVNIMEANLNIGVTYCRADLFGAQKGTWDLPNYSLEKMLLDNIVFVTALFYKSDWERVGGFNTELKNGMEDYDFWLSILEIEKEIYQIPEILFHYRIKSISRTTEFQSNMDKVKETYLQIYRNHPILFEKYKNQYAEILRDELIHQIFINKELVNRFGVFRRMTPTFLKKIIKKLIYKGVYS